MQMHCFEQRHLVWLPLAGLACLTLRKRIQLATLLEPESVAEFESLELVADEALESGAQKGVVRRTLHETAEEEVDVGYITEEPL